MIFDSYYDAYRGVISSVRVFNGVLHSGARLRYVNAQGDHDAEEVGVRLPVPTPVASLGPGEVGYLIAGIKDVGEAKVGETVTERGPACRAARGLPRTEAHGVLRALSRSTATSTRTCARR